GSSNRGRLVRERRAGGQRAYRGQWGANAVVGGAEISNQNARLKTVLQRIVQFSLRYRGVVIVLGCVTVAYGLYVAAHSKLDVFPEFAPPQVVIQTEAPGLSPEEVEALVTRP